MQPLEELTQVIKDAPEKLEPIHIDTDTKEIIELTDSTNVMLNKINKLVLRIE